jgi:hypothetical protein
MQIQQPNENPVLIQKLRDLYDNTPGMTLGKLSKMTGIAENEIWFILTCLD